jgi:hypothetical protein
MTTAEMYRLPVQGGSTAMLGPAIRVLFLSGDAQLISCLGTASNPYRPIGPSEDRAEALRALAQWSIDGADLDWDHLDRIDELGWGTSG